MKLPRNVRELDCTIKSTPIDFNFVAPAVAAIIAGFLTFFIVGPVTDRNSDDMTAHAVIVAAIWALVVIVFILGSAGLWALLKFTKHRRTLTSGLEMPQFCTHNLLQSLAQLKQCKSVGVDEKFIEKHLLSLDSIVNFVRETGARDETEQKRICNLIDELAQQAMTVEAQELEITAPRRAAEELNARDLEDLRREHRETMFSSQFNELQARVRG